MVAARTAGLDLVNLGFSGNAVLDPFVARAIRDQPADVITLKLGINVVNHDAIHLRAFAPAVHGFLDTIRDGHPTTPLVVVSPLLCPLVETTPGPTSLDPADPSVFRTTGHPSEVADGKLTLTVIRSVLRAVVDARADSALTYVDGTSLYGWPDWDDLPDARPHAPGRRRPPPDRNAVRRGAPATGDTELADEPQDVGPSIRQRRKVPMCTPERTSAVDGPHSHPRGEARGDPGGRVRRPRGIGRGRHPAAAAAASVQRAGREVSGARSTRRPRSPSGQAGPTVRKRPSTRRRRLAVTSAHRSGSRSRSRPVHPGERLVLALVHVVVLQTLKVFDGARSVRLREEVRRRLDGPCPQRD